MMKRLAMAAFLLLAVSSAPTEAGPLPKAKSVIDRDVASHTTPYVRAPRKLPEPVRFGNSTTHKNLHLTHFVRGQ
jgi:hypothetical protein